MPLARSATAGLALILAASVPVLAQQDAPDAAALKPALSAQISYLDHDGAQLDQIAPDQPFIIEARLNNEAGGQTPRGIELFGWLRRESIHNLPCLQAARGYFGTGRLSLDAVPLLGPVVGVVASDNSFTVVDPFLDLATANLIGASSLPERPAALVADPAGAGFLLSLPDAGEIRHLTAFGASATTLASGLARPETLIVSESGTIWVYQAASRKVSQLSANGDELTHFADAVGLSGDARTVIITHDDGGAKVVSADDGVQLAVLPAGSAADALPVHDAEGALMALARPDDTGLLLHYIDAPGNPQPVALAAPVRRLVADRQGRFLIGWDPSGGPASIVDLARGHMLQAVDGDGIAISEVLITDNAAFFMLADHSLVGAIELAALGFGREAPIRHIPLGQPSAAPVDAPGMLVALTPRSEVLAVHPDTYTGFFLHETSVMGDAPPMSSVRLRGGVPAMTAVLDRGFRQDAAGRFRAGAILPGEGRFELVLTTGIGGMTVCAALPTARQDEPATGPARIDAVIGPSGADGRRPVTLSFADAAGAPLEVPRGVVTLAALEAGWTGRIEVAPGSDPIIMLPPLGTFVGTIASLDGSEFSPFILEVAP